MLMTPSCYFDQNIILKNFDVTLFDGEYYKQIDGVAMGSPLEPTFVNTFQAVLERRIPGELIHKI